MLLKFTVLKNFSEISMCSVQEEEIEVLASRLEKKFSRGTVRVGRTCMKCSTNAAVVVVRLNDPLCRSCFLAYFTHKFRATIGKARAIRAGERVLLAFSGGPSSSAMLDLVREGLGNNVAKKLRFEPGIAFVDEGEILKQSEAERSEFIQHVRDAVSKTQFPFLMVKLEDVFTPTEVRSKDDARLGNKIDRQENEIQCAHAQKLRSLFDSLSSMTAKEDLLKTLRAQLLIMLARREGYTKIMMADSATRISIRLLSNIAQGRGGDLPYDTGFSDDRHGDVAFLRPMREFMSKEIALYNFFNKVETVHVPTFATMSYSHASIDRLAEEFVCGLQADFPFTVSTIFRTGDKLSIKESSHDAGSCALCGVLMSAESALISSLDEVSGNLDSSEGQELGSDEGCCGGCDRGCSSKQSEAVSRESILQALCYGCGLTFQKASFELEDLPSFVVENVQRTNRMSQMKEQIKEFLLDD